MGYKVLGFDSSGPMLSVAMIEDGVLLARRELNIPRLAGTHLVAFVEEQVAHCGRPDGIAVGVGPGSFTGVRIAVTAAKAFALSWKIPVKGVSSLAAWAKAEVPGSRVVVTSERRGPAFYLGYYYVGDDKVEAIIPDMAISGTLPPIFPLSDAIKVLGPLNQNLHDLARIGMHSQKSEAVLSGLSIAQLGWSALQWGHTDDPVTLAPAYLRPPAISVPK